MDRQTRLVWLGTGVAVAVVWVVGLTVGRGERTRAPVSEAEAAMRVEGVEGAQPADPSMASRPTKVAAAPAPSAPSPTSVDKEHRSGSQVLPPAFATETRDALWAKDAETSIRSAFADAHVAESALLSVECRRRICRAEMWFDPREHLAFGKAYASLRGPFGIEIGFENLANGIRGEPERVAAYFPRKGYALQDFESTSR